MTTGQVDEPRIWPIGDLNRRASRAVVLDFRGPVWTEGELTKIDERRGSRYLQLVERGGGRDGRDAHLVAYCSPTRWQRLERKLSEAGVALRAGQSVRLGGCLEIGDRGRLTLTVDDVDVAALVGDRMRARQQLVRQLVADDLFDANRRLVLVPLPLRVGLVASAGSDGHGDLLRQLESSGFAFAVTFRAVAVEGPTAPRLLKAALSTFGPADVDVVVVVRGGGAKASLDVFDQPAVAHAIATSVVPVWTGIGHTGDRTVADEVAHRCFPTPTAVGQALVAAVVGAWDELAGAVTRIGRLVDARLAVASAHVAGERRSLSTAARHRLTLHEQAQGRASTDLVRGAARCLDDRSGQLVTAASHIRASGGAELRHAERRLADVARDSASAARRRCADATVELAAGAGAVTGGAAAALAGAGRPIERAQASLTRARFDRMVDLHATDVAGAGRRLAREVQRRLSADTDRAAARRAVLEAYDPQRQLARGWTLTHTVDGRLLRHASQVQAGQALVTTFAGGEATSTVTAVLRPDDEEAAP